MSTPHSDVVLSDRIWTIPNAITMVRIVLIGVFFCLLISENDGWAITALAIAGFSDFFDGYLARKYNSSTKLGRLLDPAADRLLTIVVVIGLAWRDIVPWWIVVFLLARDVMVGLMLLYARKHGVSSSQVTWTGKAATAGLLFFLPLSYLAFERWDGIHSVAIAGLILVGAAYWYSGFEYVRDLRQRAAQNG